VTWDAGWTIDTDRNVIALPAVALPRTRSLCLFRCCDWALEDTGEMPPDVLEEIVAGHLLSDHRPELTALGRLAEDGELL
jgi:(2Fe-2S) ferredoxin